MEIIKQIEQNLEYNKNNKDSVSLRRLICNGISCGDCPVHIENETCSGGGTSLLMKWYKKQKIRDNIEQWKSLSK
jgi:hypothetical protein